MMYHTPVLLEEAIEALNVVPGGCYADCTVGGSGHTQAILARLGQGRLLGFDQDPDATANLPVDGRFLFVHANFRYLKNYVDYFAMGPLDGILADLGVSSHQFDTGSRGFSFRDPGPLDMRMNPASPVDAALLLNTIDEWRLGHILKEYGGVQAWRPVVKAIIHYRTGKTFKTVADLVECLAPLTPSFQSHKFLARIFQAIRMEVNQEMESLHDLLAQAPSVLKPGGRLVVITFHSVEDKMVKDFMKRGSFEDEGPDLFGNIHSVMRLVNRKPSSPTDREMAENNRSRSAKMRVAERI